jgi:prepilin-type N-terminal cleavage/methylation domain-containing protein
MRARIARGSAGFTLVELLVVIFLLSVVGTITSASVIRGFHLQARQTSQTESLNKAKVAFERMSQEVRGANPIRIAEAQRLELLILRNDTVVSGGSPVPRTLRRVLTYVATPGAGTGRIHLTEQRFETVNGVAATPTTSTRTVIDGLQLGATERVFTYFETPTSAGAATLAPGLVRLVEMRVRVDRVKSDGVADLYQRVSLRNTEA